MPSITERSSLRDQSRDTVFALIAETREGLTRSELASHTGMSRSTIIHAVSRLLAEGRIAETEPEDKGPGSGSGRPASRLIMAPSDELVGGLDFGHNHIGVAIADSTGAMIKTARETFDVDLDARGAIAKSAQLMRSLVAEDEIRRLACVVAGIPGPIDTRTGIVTSPTILSGWVGLAPALELSAAIGHTVHAENDAVLGAYAEARIGSGRYHRDFLYVKASHGIGASLILDGKPYRGATGIAGEIGHTHLAGRTELCRCGDRGCLEAEVSIQAVRQQLEHTHPHLNITTLRLSTLTDPVAGRILNEAGRTVGQVLADLCNLINPAAIVIGGELGSSGDAFISGVRSSIQRYAQPATAAVLEVLAAQLGDDTELHGAVQLAATLARI
jgi:predicted NBD/HSP70 family sugar kinase